jgi:hypothetical protein
VQCVEGAGACSVSDLHMFSEARRLALEFWLPFCFVLRSCVALYYLMTCGRLLLWCVGACS